MLQIVTEGKNTSVRGAVIVSTVVTTVALLNSEACLKTKQQATMTDVTTITIQKDFHPDRLDL